MDQNRAYGIVIDAPVFGIGEYEKFHIVFYPDDFARQFPDIESTFVTHVIFCG